MSQHKVIVCCWKHGHQTELSITKKQEEKLVDKISKLKAVCPFCRDHGFGNQAIFIKEGSTLFSQSKLYRCSHGHITAIHGFTNGMLNMCYGVGSEDFINVHGTLQELPELIDTKDISCHHMLDNGITCDSQLEAVDSFVLSYPITPGIKTRTRIGDLWDRAGVEPVRPGSYDSEHNYKSTKSERANRERLNRIRERNISVDRHPGKRINKPTDYTYERRSKNQINPDRLPGPR